MGRHSHSSGFGLRRISWVRIDLTGTEPRAEVAGVGQHRPVTRSVPLRVAQDLAADGTPTFVRRSLDVPPVHDLAGAG